MKNLFLTLLLLTSIYANDIAITMQLSKTKAYVGEVLVLDVNISQTDHSKVMLFQFSPQKSDKYQFYQVDFKEDNRHHNLKHRYRYLIYPTSSGVVEIGFDMVKSITDDSKIAYSISGDRDNVKGLVKKDIPVMVTPLTLDILPVPKGVELIGDYTLEYTIDKSTADAFEPINLAVSIKGSGLTLEAFELINKSPTYTLFKQKPVVKNYHLQDSTKSSIEWHYALSAQKNFTLDAIELKAFNPATHKNYTLSIPKTQFTINAIKKEELVDKVDYPKAAKSIDWGWLFLVISYIGIFIAGFLTPRDILKRFKKEIIVQSEFEVEIEEAKTKKELLALLLAQNDRRFESIIDTINNKETHTLKKLKGMIRTKIDSSIQR
ncbi:MAG: BatD family protein [Campylobacterales bacterium]|nr:BatD family protein [Campylobacterales bacterium]